MMEKLKACPFCGKKMQITTSKCITADGSKTGYHGYCAECGMHTQTRFSEEEAIADVNRRAEPENKPQELCSKDENFIQTKFGYCFYTLDSNPLIYNLYVHPQYRRCGHSNTLLRLAIGRIRGNGYKGDIRIQAEPRENSIGLEDLTKYYKSMGLIVEYPQT